MAARTLRKFHTDEIREKIKTTQLLNRLTNHALGEIDLSQTQVRAIEILLRKSILPPRTISYPSGSSIAVKGGTIFRLGPLCQTEFWENLPSLGVLLGAERNHQRHLYADGCWCNQFSIQNFFSVLVSKLTLVISIS